MLRRLGGPLVTNLRHGGVKNLFLSALLPPSAWAGEPGGAPPVGAGLGFTLTVAAPRTRARMSGPARLDNAGTAHSRLNVEETHAHTLDVILTGGAVHLGNDGGPCESMALGDAAPGDTSAGELPQGCAIPIGNDIANLSAGLGPAGLDDSFLQPVGETTVDSVTVQHLRGRLDGSAAAPFLGGFHKQIFGACGEAAQEFPTNVLTSALQGATLEIDAYANQPMTYPDVRGRLQGRPQPARQP